MSEYTSEDEENWMRAVLEDVTPASLRDDMKKRLGSLLLTKASESFQREQRAASEARAKALTHAELVVEHELHEMQALREDWTAEEVRTLCRELMASIRALKTKGAG